MIDKILNRVLVAESAALAVIATWAWCTGHLYTAFLTSISPMVVVAWWLFDKTGLMDALFGDTFENEKNAIAKRDDAQK
ncbi:hypothetical protein [Limosilactobacillus mucosae]|uniref:hypothetical protein n=1 Tax=Limosilactobacillus mucosae TaxID=97478 RepID=UPI000FFBE891|nr:hypothetical protein [Limosilactobacillus mucosae]RXA58175.1 hypothetical protein EQ839_03005 [Limosilactobacillus mucosae]